MRTSKPISTISYNSIEFLKLKLNEMIKAKKICDYMFIKHKAEKDERKDHIHLYLKPNTLLDTMDIQEYLKEIDLNNPTKPLGCIDFRISDVDNWILYEMHDKAYLASKFESREYTYSKEDFYYYDEDNFEELFYHAFHGSEWAHRNQLLEVLADSSNKPANLILNGSIPLSMASQLNAFKYMQRAYGLDRGEHEGHE